jgi:hypothetical protein
MLKENKGIIIDRYDYDSQASTFKIPVWSSGSRESRSDKAQLRQERSGSNICLGSESFLFGGRKNAGILTKMYKRRETN